MKIRVMKTAIVLLLVTATVAGSAQAYFTSTVTSEGNNVSTGILALAIDSIEIGSSNYFNVVKDVNGVSTLGANFSAWENATPGESHSYWVAYRNIGTLSFELEGSLTGTWQDFPRANVGSCPATADDELLTVSTHRSDMAGGCDANDECTNLRNSLIADGEWTPKSGQTEADNVVIDGSLEVNEFVIYRLDVEFVSSENDNCYQGAMYQLDLSGYASQL